MINSPPIWDYDNIVYILDVMAPPTYGDLGKAAKDIFSKGYSA